LIPISALLATILNVSGQDIPIEECNKYDGGRPNRCELALANRAMQFGTALEQCAILYRASADENDKLKELLFSKPVHEEPTNFALFGMPGWVTPVLGAVLVGAGFGIGLAL